MPKILTFLLLVFGFEFFSQTCDCNKEFAFVKKFMEINYAGFRDKVTLNATGKNEYAELCQKLELEAAQTNQEVYCFAAMNKYLHFFKDHHVSIFKRGDNTVNENDSVAVRKIIDAAPRIALTKEQMEAIEKKPKEDIEGIYIHNSGNYKIALIQNKTNVMDYAGVIISAKNKFWLPGMIKIQLKKESDDKFESIMYDRFHGAMLSSYTIKNGLIGNAEFAKEGAKPEQSEKPFRPFEKLEDSLVTFFKVINDSTNYMRIRSFASEYGSDIDSILAANNSLLRSKPYLIIDLRYNGGGSDGSYSNILPYIYSQPYKGIGVDILATPDNVISLKRMLKQNEKYFDKGDLKRLNDLAAKMEKNPNKFISSADDSVTKFDSVYKFPKKVAVIINEGCGSTTEQFLLDARQSKKVTLYGKHTLGVLDYSNVRMVDLPCMNYTLGYATTRSRRIPKEAIDNIGIMPKIELDLSKDWMTPVLAGFK